MYQFSINSVVENWLSELVPIFPTTKLFFFPDEINFLCSSFARILPHLETFFVTA